MGILRAQDARFELHIYGGNRLWGGAEQAPAQEDGVFYHGMVGQRELSRELRTSHIALNLQDRLEPFGLSLIEAMASGNIVVASPMGDSAAAGAIRADDEVDASPGGGADSANAASASADGTTGDQSSGRPNRRR